MENVPDVIGKKNINDFLQWKQKLELLGYSNYVQIINAADMGIPQNRRRCFMISLLGEWYYEFPSAQPLKLLLKDLLEEQVDEKFYLSEKQIETFKNHTKEQKEKGNGFKFTPTDGNVIAKTCIASGSLKITNNFINVCGSVNIGVNESSNRVYSSNGLSPTLTTMQGGNTQPKIKCDDFIIPEATQKGYAIAKEGDGVYINRPQQKRGCVQKDMIQTLKTNCSDIGVINHHRIRRLTPLECWRLMGFDDRDFSTAQKVSSNTQLYKFAGNSIVKNVLIEIFRKLLE